ncbi:MAG: glycosyltransferase family 39 protein, partial [Candidatus Eremiobacteraeota bacterium]|nr:glycosyltransferase family 39 protein [Candidatus Eremiobacteraeota bacterium]
MVCFCAALLTAKTQFATTWQQRVPNGVPVAAHFGDRISVRPLVPGTVTFASYPLAIQSTAATHDTPAVFQSSGNDTYEITNNHQGALDVTLEEMQPAISPWVTALLLFAAPALVLLSVLSALGMSSRPVPWTLDKGSLLLLAGSLLLFALVPRYLHNDQVGGGINWGYLGWGYVDTLHALSTVVHQDGLLGLIGVESLSKPILYPILAWPIAALTGALNGAIVVSLITAAAAAVAIYRLGVLLFERSVGALAAVLFICSPLVLAYASSFYLDLPYVMFTAWSAVFLIVGLRRQSATSLVIGLLFGIIAVGVRNPIMAVLYFFSIAFLLLAARTAPLRAIGVALGGAIAAFMGAVFLWPFLWIDTLHRLPFVLVARLLFEHYYHISEPVAQRIATMTAQTFVHTDPLTVLLLIAGVVAALLHRDVRIAWLAGGLVIARLFVAPSSFYLQHYWFYMAPFLQLIGGYAITLLSVRLRVAAVATAAVVVFAWSALYFPYASAATLGCTNFTCSAQRYGVDEPVYGLKEASAWIRAHVARGRTIGTLVAPHTLQFALPEYVVRFLFLPPDPKMQQTLLANAAVSYLVSNAWTRYRDHERVLAPHVQRVWKGPSKEGMVSIFRVTGAAQTTPTLDAPPLSDL